LKKLLNEILNGLLKLRIDRNEILSKTMLSPATCCLVNKDKEKSVEKAFFIVKKLSYEVKEE